MVRTRQKPVAQTVVPVPPPLPGWTRLDAPVTDINEAVFQAGAALAMLDLRMRADVRAQVPFAGAWRRRLALKAAVASVRISRRGEDEAMLRDALLLRQGGDDPGPAGRMLVACLPRSGAARNSSSPSRPGCGRRGPTPSSKPSSTKTPCGRRRAAAS
jgi:hypothetical protein